ncbi:MAG: TM2 domain-containing protein [Cyclobacteriaceae bacterium]|nr:TM2 domain-containing protein [Cyclobacteriaceae bacterium]
MYARAQSFEQDMAFLQHLKEISAYDEGLFLIGQLQENTFAPGRRDTLNFYKGKFNYYKKNLAVSIASFDQVSSLSPFWPEAFIVARFQQAYSGDHQQAYDQLIRQDFDEAIFSELKLFELAGIDLLNRDFDSYSKHAAQYAGNFHQLSASQKRLDDVAGLFATNKSKSPLLAGVLSTVLPGAGKFYLGRVGEGAMTLITTGIFGVQAWEGYQKDGINSARFIIFASLFSGTYIANIWGSVLGVKILRNEFNDQMNETILVTMHVPIRLLFD